MNVMKIIQAVIYLKFAAHLWLAIESKEFKVEVSGKVKLTKSKIIGLRITLYGQHGISTNELVWENFLGTKQRHKRPVDEAKTFTDIDISRIHLMKLIVYGGTQDYLILIKNIRINGISFYVNKKFTIKTGHPVFTRPIVIYTIKSYNFYIIPREMKDIILEINSNVNISITHATKGEIVESAPFAESVNLLRVHFNNGAKAPREISVGVRYHEEIIYYFKRLHDTLPQSSGTYEDYEAVQGVVVKGYFHDNASPPGDLIIEIIDTQSERHDIIGKTQKRISDVHYNELGFALIPRWVEAVNRIRVSYTQPNPLFLHKVTIRMSPNFNIPLVNDTVYTFIPNCYVDQNPKEIHRKYEHCADDN